MSTGDEAETRRETPLAAKLKARIAETGPVSVRDYMELCLADPEHGYYRSRTAIGAAGDFITAPEISQVFGELIGLWSAVTWQQMGAPDRLQLVEVGPGRGTMMADIVRVARKVPGFADAVRIVLVEPHPGLREAQKHALAGAFRDVRWVADLTEIDAEPTVLLGNEFLDVVPIAQLVRREGGWYERTVGLDEAGGLVFQESDILWTNPLPEAAARAPIGAVLEVRDLSIIAKVVSTLAIPGPLAALFIDYGHEATGFGDTLQAVRQHRQESPLTSPGEADLTSMVDFEAAARALSAPGLVVERLVTQAEFLGALGIAERASRLMSANPARAGEIELGIARLMSPQSMGTRFKVLGVRSAGLPELAGFPLARDS